MAASLSCSGIAWPRCVSWRSGVATAVPSRHGVCVGGALDEGVYRPVLRQGRRGLRALRALSHAGPQARDPAAGQPVAAPGCWLVDGAAQDMGSDQGHGNGRHGELGGARPVLRAPDSACQPHSRPVLRV